MASKKLSKAQREVVDRLQKGHILRVSSIGSAHITNGKFTGNEFMRVNITTFKALEKAGYLTEVPCTRSFHREYVLRASRG